MLSGILRDRAVEQAFFGIYGSPVLQGMLGLNLDEKVRELPPTSRKSAPSSRRRWPSSATAWTRAGSTKPWCGPFLFVIAADRQLDERCAAALKETCLRLTQLSISDFKSLVRRQFYILLLERMAAVEAIATLVPTAPRDRAS